MDWLTNLIWFDGKFLGIEWSIWKVVGWGGNLAFSTRFLIQWYASEKSKRVVVPTVFWWLSLLGSLLFLIYSLHKQDSVFIYAYAFNWLPYIRNLVIHYRHKDAHTDCAGCGNSCPPQAKFCPECGLKLAVPGQKQKV
ncbi:MAG: lipid-A-disaccharide synthase N-terminal domain-containing protein [Akkermansiaceae bacterium]|nr:lipid-A-disaccharide synthase N-terminal domain-containing protein [Verrucomicrobiales bacterium]